MPTTPSQTDLITGFDPSGYSYVTTSQLLTMLSAASPYTDKGLVMTTTDVAGVPQVPDATTYPKWQNYIWLRIIPTTLSFGVYAWNPNQTYILMYTGGSVTTNWTPLQTGSIPAASIFGYQLADATVTAAKIVSVDVSQITGFTPSSYAALASTPGGTILGGTYAAPTINNHVITGTMIANDNANGIVTANINDAQVTSAKIAASGVLTANIADANITTGKIADKNVTAGKVLGGTNGQLLQTTDGSNTAAWVSATTAVSGTFAQTLASPGYTTLPNGLILQWGRGTGGGAPQAVTFPIAFPTGCLNVQVSVIAGDGRRSSAVAVTATGSTTGFSYYTGEGGVGNENYDVFWLAIGH